jgi:hypothetical protein
MALCLLGLEAELKGHAAEDQADQHQDERQVQRREHHRVGQREGAKQRRAAQHQPGFVTVPNRATVFIITSRSAALDEREEDADPRSKPSMTTYIMMPKMMITNQISGRSIPMTQFPLFRVSQ